MTLAPEVQAERLLDILQRMIALQKELVPPQERRRAVDRDREDPEVTLVCWTCARETQTPIGTLRRPMVLNAMIVARHRGAGHVVEAREEAA